MAMWSSGAGGRSASMKSTKSSADRGCSAALNRRSKPIVELGFALSDRPHADPEK